MCSSGAEAARNAMRQRLFRLRKQLGCEAVQGSTVLALAIALALMAVTALTGLWPMFWVSLVPTFFGVVMGVAGLVELPLHPQALIKLLS